MDTLNRWPSSAHGEWINDIPNDATKPNNEQNCTGVIEDLGRLLSVAPKHPFDGPVTLTRFNRWPYAVVLWIHWILYLDEDGKFGPASHPNDHPTPWANL